MTTQPQATYSHMTTEQYQALRAYVDRAYAALATEWGVEAVGRDYPDHVTRRDGYRFTRPGKWYVVVNGERVRATAAQARALHRAGGGPMAPYGSIGPIAAAR